MLLIAIRNDEDETVKNAAKAGWLGITKKGQFMHHFVRFFVCNIHYHFTNRLSSPRGAQTKKIPYQAPPTQLGPQKCTFWKNAV